MVLVVHRQGESGKRRKGRKVSDSFEKSQRSLWAHPYCLSPFLGGSGEGCSGYYMVFLRIALGVISPSDASLF